MPKAKKAKTSHQNGHDDRLLTDAEIWDDSALIRSWDEAVKEYELYHSIHVRGEDVEEVLRRAREEGEEEYQDADVDVDLELSARNGSSSSQKRQTPVIFGPSVVPRGDEEDSDLDEGEIAEEVVQSGGTDENMKAKSSKLEPVQPSSTTNATSSASLPGGNGLAPSDPNSDPTLENLKMAYWWAGYYSGLYEGQRQAALR